MEEKLNDIDKRLAVTESQLGNIATKEGLAKLENRVLGRLIWMMVAVYGAAAAVMVRALFFSGS